MFSAFRQLFLLASQAATPAQRRSGRGRAFSIRPSLEVLEDRTVPSTWVGGGYAGDPHGTGDFTAGRAWSNPANWFGGVPGPSDTATFTHNVTYTVIDNTGSHTVSGPATDPILDGSFTIGALQIDSTWGGTMGSSAVGNTLTFGGASQFASGNVGGQNWIDNGTLTIAGGTFASGGVLTNNGTVTQTGTLGVNSTTLDNTAGAVWDFQDDANISFVGLVVNGSSFNNSGTVRKSTGTETSTIGEGAGGCNFNNAADATLDVRSGTLAFLSGTNTGGTISISPGAALELGGTYTGIYTVSGGGNVQVDTNQVLNVGATPVTFDFNAGSFQWTGGVIRGQGGITIDGSLDITAGVTLGTTLTNGGTITETGGGINFQGGVLHNPAGHLFDMQSDAGFGVSTNSSGAVNNAGTFRKSAGAGSASLQLPFNNNGGTIDVESGTLELVGDRGVGGSGTGGTFTVAAGGLLELDAPDAGFALSGTWTGSGAGLVQLDTNIDVGTAGATFDFAPGLLQWTGGRISGQGGLTNAGSLTLMGGSLATTLSNNGTIVETSGGLGFAGGVVNNAVGGLVDIQTDAGFSYGTNSFGEVINAGTFRKSAGTGTANLAIAFKNSGGTLDVESGTVNLGDGWENTTQGDASFSNTGVVKVGSGTLTILAPSITQASGGTLTGGTWIVSSGATLSLPNVTNFSTNNGSVTLSGPGSNFTNINGLSVNTGAFNLLGGRTFTTAGDLSNTGTLALGPASTLTVAGNYSQGSSGTLSVQLGGNPASGAFGKLTTTQAATLDGTLQATLADGYVPSVSDTFPVVGYGPGSGGNFASLALPRSGGVVFQAVVSSSGVTLTAQPVITDSDLTLSANSIHENDTVTLNGQLHDPDPARSHTMTITWGDGSLATTLNLAAGVLTFSSSHRFLNNTPVGSASGSDPIGVTVTDDQGNNASASTSITVSNVAATLGGVTVTAPLAPNGAATLGGALTDPGSQDAFVLRVDWGDGSVQSFNLAAGTTSFRETHSYAAPGSSPIHLSVTDDDGATASASTSVTVPAGLVHDVTSLVQVTRGKPRRRGNRIQQTVMLKNTSAQALAGPMSLVLDRLPRGFKLVNRVGTTRAFPPLGSPYVDVALPGDGIFRPGETVTSLLVFSAPPGQSLTYKTRVLDGLGVR